MKVNKKREFGFGGFGEVKPCGCWEMTMSLDWTVDGGTVAVPWSLSTRPSLYSLIIGVKS